MILNNIFLPGNIIVGLQTISGAMYKYVLKWISRTKNNGKLEI
jgi:hypothetical protein